VETAYLYHQKAKLQPLLTQLLSADVQTVVERPAKRRADVCLPQRVP